MANGIGVILPAAGAGRRLGGVSKPLIEIGGEPVIRRLLKLFERLQGIKQICLAVPKAEMSAFERAMQPMEFQSFTTIVEGGTERQLSVRNAFQSLKEKLNNDDLVCIHDAARPLLSSEDLDKVISAGWKFGAAFLAAPVKDTLKKVDENNFCESTVDRSGLFAAQTPQVMTAGLLGRAYREISDLTGVTDEMTLLERIGVKSFVVEPSHINPKITTPDDLELLLRLTSL